MAEQHRLGVLGEFDDHIPGHEVAIAGHDERVPVGNPRTLRWLRLEFTQSVREQVDDEVEIAWVWGVCARMLDLVGSEAPIPRSQVGDRDPTVVSECQSLQPVGCRCRPPVANRHSIDPPHQPTGRVAGETHVDGRTERHLRAHRCGPCSDLRRDRECQATAFSAQPHRTGVDDVGVGGGTQPNPERHRPAP